MGRAFTGMTQKNHCQPCFQGVFLGQHATLFTDSNPMATRKSELYSALRASRDELRGGMDARPLVWMLQVNGLMAGVQRMSPALSVPEGYKMTEAGLIANDWESLALGNIAKLQHRFDLPGIFCNPGGSRPARSSRAWRKRC